jgi:transposase
MRRQLNGPELDVRAALFALLGKDLTQINGLGPYLALKLIAECGDDLSVWPSAKHFTSWLCAQLRAPLKLLRQRSRRPAMIAPCGA